MAKFPSGAPQPIPPPWAAELSQAATTSQWHQAAASPSFKIHSDKKKNPKNTAVIAIKMKKKGF